MNIEQFRDFCLSKPGTTEEVPFGPTTLVFKVIGKMFALTSLDTFQSINLKCDPEEAVILREQYEGVSAGYHMNKKHWNTVLTDGSIADEKIFQWTDNSYQLVVEGLSKTLRDELAKK